MAAPLVLVSYCQCERCANADPADGTFRIIAGEDGDPGIRPSVRQFVSYAAPWEPIPRPRPASLSLNAAGLGVNRSRRVSSGLREVRLTGGVGRMRVVARKRPALWCSCLVLPHS